MLIKFAKGVYQKLRQLFVERDYLETDVEEDYEEGLSKFDIANKYSPEGVTFGFVIKDNPPEITPYVFIKDCPSAHIILCKVILQLQKTGLGKILVNHLNGDFLEQFPEHEETVKLAVLAASLELRDKAVIDPREVFGGHK